jgi:hypothetical protein
MLHKTPVGHMAADLAALDFVRPSAVRRAALPKRAISFLSFSFSARSPRSRSSAFSRHVVKLPRCTSMPRFCRW